MTDSLPVVRFVKLRLNAQTPQYMTDGAAGLDLFAAPEESIIIEPNQRFLVPTGIAIDIPTGFEGQVRPRSGLALKRGITLPNSPGTIDSDYRGEVGIIMMNLGEDPFVVNAGDRIAQLIIAPVSRAIFKEVDSLDNTTRSTGGFGHTGVTEKGDI